MPLSRRTLLTAAPAGATLAWRPARADTYPSKPIRFIVGFAPGGGTDFNARLTAEALGARLGQTVVVENRPGASAAIALDYVAKAPPDGYTLAFGSSDGTTMLAAVRQNLPYDIGKDFSYIARTVQEGYVVTAGPKLGVHSLAELVTYAKAHPGKLRYGTNGAGSSTHLATLLLQQAAGIDMTAVPYRGGAAQLTDVLNGNIDLAYLPLVTLGDNAHSDKIATLAVTSPEREEALPEVPTLAQAGYPRATVTIWLGVMGPAGLPPAIRDRLGNAIADAMRDPAVTQRLTRLAIEPAPLTGEEFRKMALADYAEWKTVVKDAHLVVQ